MIWLKSLKNLTNLMNLRNILKLIFEKHKYVFFSEDKNYQKYFINFIKKIDSKNEKFFYVSSEKDDYLVFQNVTNVYIGKRFLRNIIFQIISSKFLFLTITDLDNHDLKRSKLVKKYVYIFHSPMSIHRSYTKNAFNNYDIIFCTGDYQLNEFKKEDKIKPKLKREYIKSGYFYFDYLQDKYSIIKNKKHNNSLDTFLLAPSWNYDDNNFLNLQVIEVIEFLLTQNNKVIFRPHIEHLKRSSEILNSIKDKFSNNKNFEFDDNNNNFESMNKADILITDTSGISMEFCLIFKKPVIYFDKYLKIHNSEFTQISEKTIEDEVKSLFGYSYTNENLDSFLDLIHQAKKDFLTKEKKIDDYLKCNFYNLNCSAEYSYNKINENS